MKLYVLPRKDDVRSFEQALQIHLFGDPAEGADDDRASWNRLGSGNGMRCFDTCIAGRKDDAFKRMVDFVERSTVFRCEMPRVNCRDVQDTLLGEPGLSCVLLEQKFAKQVAGKVAGDLIGDPRLKIMGQMNQDGSIAGEMLHVLYCPAHSILIEHHYVVDASTQVRARSPSDIVRSQIALRP